MSILCRMARLILILIGPYSIHFLKMRFKLMYDASLYNPPSLWKLLFMVQPVCISVNTRDSAIRFRSSHTILKDLQNKTVGVTFATNIHQGKFAHAYKSFNTDGEAFASIFIGDYSYRKHPARFFFYFSFKSTSGL